MTNDFRSYNVIYIVYDRKNENHWSLLVTHYSLLITHYSEYKHPKYHTYDITVHNDFLVLYGFLLHYP